MTRDAVRPRRLLPAAAVIAVFLWVGAADFAAAQSFCVGDCNDNGNVSTPELETGVDIALGDLASFETCMHADQDGDQAVTIDDLVRAVDEHLNECDYVTPTPTPTPALPDLIPIAAGLVATPPAGGCIDSLSDIHSFLEVCVRNQGEGSAPAFQALVGAIVIDFQPLPPSQSECSSTPSEGEPGGIEVFVDPENHVAESDETNNSNTYFVAVLTPPLTCTPTVTNTPLPPGSPSETPEPTDTPTPTQTMTPTCACTVTATRPVTPSTPTPTPTATDTPGLPDLIPNRIILVAPTPVGGCVNSVGEVKLSLLACVLNDSNGAAGPFEATIMVSATIPIEFSGAPADSEVCESTDFVGGPVIFSVDTRNEVAEKNESNNQAVFSIPVPTPPPICATKTPTPTLGPP